jgi:hypothetical protein
MYVCKGTKINYHIYVKLDVILIKIIINPLKAKFLLNNT